MKLASRLIVPFIAALLTALPVAAPAQVYPSNNPTYIPTAILPATTLTAAGTVTFNSNGNGTLLIRVAGTNTALSGTVQVTESRATSPSWTTVAAQTVGGVRVNTITAAGLYRINVAGAAQVRFNLASLTGTNVIVSASATPGPEFLATLPATQATYAAAFTLTPAASATDFFTLTGSASKTARVSRVSCSGTATASGTGTLVALKRSTATTGGTSSAATATAFDSNYPTAAATALTFTANGTTGTLLGNLRNASLVLTPPTSSISVQPLAWDFGTRPGDQAPTLRGTSEVFALNGAGASFPAGTALLCNVTWTEE